MPSLGRVKIELNCSSPGWCPSIASMYGESPTDILESVIRTPLKVYVIMVILPFSATLTSYINRYGNSTHFASWGALKKCSLRVGWFQGEIAPIHLNLPQELNGQLHQFEQKSLA